MLQAWNQAILELLLKMRLQGKAGSQAAISSVSLLHDHTLVSIDLVQALLMGVLLGLFWGNIVTLSIHAQVCALQALVKARKSTATSLLVSTGDRQVVCIVMSGRPAAALGVC